MPGYSPELPSRDWTPHLHKEIRGKLATPLEPPHGQIPMNTKQLTRTWSEEALRAISTGRGGDLDTRQFSFDFWTFLVKIDVWKLKKNGRRSPCQDLAGNRTTRRPDHPKKRCKLQWYGHVYRPSGLAKTILRGTVKGGRRQGRQKKSWEDNIREWTGLEFVKSRETVVNREKRRKLVVKSSVVPQRSPAV